MTTLEKEITEKIHILPESYLKEVLDFVEFLNKKYENISDTELLNSIKGMAESIEEGKKESIDECKSLSDIGWD